MDINIVYTPINHYYYMLYVSMYSVIVNNTNNNINFYILHDKTFEKEYIKGLKAFEKYKNCISINFIEINQTENPDIDNFGHSLYCLQLPKLINEDKALFLNTLNIVNTDLSEVYSTDISDFACAAVEYTQEAKNVKIKVDRDFVFTNSFMLINLKNWKENNYYKKLTSQDFILANIRNNRRLLEHETYNILLKDCKKLPLTYCYAEMWYTKEKQVELKGQTAIDYQNFLTHIEKPKVILMVGYKPIEAKECKHSYVNLWWNYASKTEIYNSIKEFRKLDKYKLQSTSAQNSFRYNWLLSRIWPYIKPYWFRVLLGFAIAIPLGLLDGVTAFALKPYMDYVIGGKDFALNWHGINLAVNSVQMAYIIPIAVILFAAIQGILRYLNGYLSMWVSTRITNDVKFDLFERLIHMHPQFFDENSSGIIISRYMGDPGAASAGIVDQIKTITTSICGALGLIAVMLYSSWKLAIIGVLVLCVAFLPVALIRKRIKAASNKNMVIGGNITTNINETYSGNKVMAAYELQDRQNEYFKKQTWESFNVNMSLYKRAGWMSPIMYLIASMGIATVLGFGTYLINSGQMTAGSFASFVTSLLLLYKPVKTLGNTLTGIQTLFVALGRVFELFDLKPEIIDSPDAIEMKGLDSSIQFKDVEFEYIPDHPVLHNFNLTVNKNETLAIVGNSGGGKSTLVNLIPRFYDIKSGSIMIDGVDLRHFTLKSLRKNISMVFQDNFLYTGTIRENIMMGNPDAGEEDLKRAIVSAHLEETVADLPDGLDTLLGERGLTLSGGQRQRVAIARAMLRNAPIVILDEATSALDNESEAIVQKAMDNLVQNKTVFIIAHRLSTIKNADRIAVINEGNLVELGTHEELMAIENGEYKTLYEMQFKNQEKVLESI